MPHDIVYPVISKVLKQFPRVHVKLNASFFYQLREVLSRGGYDIILTTEAGTMPGGETLSQARLSCTGADLAVCLVIEVTEPPHMVAIQHGGILPEMPVSLINMYGAEEAQSRVVSALAELLRQGYSDLKTGSYVMTSTPALREMGQHHGGETHCREY